MVFLCTIIIFISFSDLTLSENETLAINATALTIIMASKIPLNGSEINESEVTDYFYGDSDINDNTQQLDLSVFEPAELKRLLETAQSKGELVERELNKSRRWYETSAFAPNSYFVTKAMDFIKQSVYGTRYRLKDTKHIRKLYSNDVAYNIAILYGSLMQLRIKMDNIYRTLYSFDGNVKFIWYLVLYERCIAATVDANFMVERMFALKQQHLSEFNDDYMKMEPPDPIKSILDAKNSNG